MQLIGALIHEPDVLVLDEPFSGLDPVAVDALSKVLVGEARRGATVLFSSHQLDLVEDLCERAVVVDRGRVVAEGTIDELTAGADPVLEIEVPNDPEGTWTSALDGGIDVLGVNAGRVRLQLPPDAGAPAERAQAVLDAARRAGPDQPLRLRATQPRRGVPGHRRSPGRGTGDGDQADGLIS